MLREMGSELLLGWIGGTIAHGWRQDSSRVALGEVVSLEVQLSCKGFNHLCQACGGGSFPNDATERSET